MDFEKRFEAHEKWLAKHDQAIALIDKQLKATAKLLAAGVKLVTDDRKRQKQWNEDFDYKMNALITAQQETRRDLNLLIKALRGRSANGHSS